jgi:hypothetical protein
MLKEKTREIKDQLKLVLTGKGNLMDTILPAILFLIIYATLGFSWALWSSTILAVGIFLWRLVKKQTLHYSAAGFASILLTVGITLLAGSARGYFLQDILIGGLITLVVFISAIFDRPLVAITSALVRRWTLTWYRHPKVAPAYREVNYLWGFFFLLKTGLQVAIYLTNNTTAIGFSNMIGGWPATIILLIFSYLYGTWRLKNLAGPSVEEFTKNIPPPWEGQVKGF